MSVTSAILSANPRLIFLIVFVGALAVLLYRDREKVQRQSILFYRKTEHGIEYIDRIAKAAPRFWNVYGWTGVVFGVLTIPTILYLVLLTFRETVSSGGTSGGASLVFPGITSEATFQSGISYIPAEYWVIGIGIMMFVHEMSHGIVARAEDMEINSVGWIVMGIIPGAFVEPKGENMLPDNDKEEQEDQEDKEENGEEDEGGMTEGMWDQGSLGSQLKVLAAGSFANYITALVFAALSLFMFVSIAHPVGVQYIAAENGSAIEAGMDNGTIYSIQGERVRYFDQMSDVLENYSPGETVTLNTSKGEFNVTLGERNGSAHLGIYGFRSRGVLPAFSEMMRDQREIKPEYADYRGALSWALDGLQIIALLNLLIGMFNMLPIKPLDGGQMVSAVVDEYLPEAGSYVNYWSLLLWAGLLASIVYSIAISVI
jgi:membrane-associated protease RseP (regulator of RpoE activity)